MTEPTTEEGRAANWQKQAERNIAPVVAQLASLYERIERSDGRHRELAEQLGDAQRGVERLTKERDDWETAAKDHVVNNARLVEERDRLQSAFDTQQGWLNECQVELKRKL